MADNELKHLYLKARDAARGGEPAWACQSTGEKLAVAMVLNRADWLTKIDYTMAEAVDRIGPAWMKHIPVVARRIRDEFPDSA